MTPRCVAAPPILLLAACFLLPPTAPSAELSLEGAILRPRERVSVPVVLKSSAQARAVQFDLVYDPALLSVSAEPGEAAQSADKQLHTGGIPGALRLMLIGMNDSAMKDGALVHLYFEVNPSLCEASPLSLQLSQTVAAGPDGEKMSVTPSVRPFEIQPPATGSIAVRNAASLAQGPLAPGEIISLFACGISAAGPVSVQVDGKPARILYTGPNQMNVVVPEDLDLAKTTTVIQVRNDATSFDLTVEVAPAMPGLFTQTSSGSGLAVAVQEDGSRNAPETPAAVQSLITLYATGVQRDVSVRIGGLAAALESFTAVESLPGTVQLGVRIPALEVDSGGTAVPVVLTSGGRESQAGVRLWVR